MARIPSILLVVGSLPAALGMMNDVIDSVKTFVAPPECPLGCMNWTDALSASEQAATFADPSILPSLGSGCAIPGRVLHSLTQPVAPVMTPMEAAAFYGPICPCRNSSATSAPVEFHTCNAQLFMPEQINLQLANSTTVVVSFVTHELSPPVAPPVARLGLANNSTRAPSTVLSGVSHWYETAHLNGSKGCVEVTGSTRKCTVRNLTMHFIRFPALEPRKEYTYQVRSGASDDAWSQLFTFRAPYGHGSAAESGGSNTTRVAIYGDMGNDANNNMGNLYADCTSGAIDAVVHMGDHAYNMGNGNDYHGDAYMQAFQDVLTRCPWLPVIGNHESTMGEGKDKVDISTQHRYLNQTWGIIYGQDGEKIDTSTARTTATTSLGHLLTRSSFYGAASHGTAPSRTSQWYSIDLGLIHFVVLDLDPGPPAVFSGAQAAWAAADLAAADANRENVPWIVVTSHFPMYTARFYEKDAWDASAAWYNAEVAEYERNGDGTPWSATPHFEECVKGAGSKSGNTTCETVKDVVEASIDSLGALLDKYHVDIYAAGHVHSYSVTWPIYGGEVANKSYVNPNGTVHVVEGNGGVPGTHRRPASVKNCTRDSPQEPPSPLGVFRMCGDGMNYGRLVTTNASVLTYEHVDNANGLVTDTWSIVKTPKSRTASSVLRDKQQHAVQGDTMATSTRQTYTYSGDARVSKSKKARGSGQLGSFGYVGLSFSILPFLPPDQNITLTLTQNELSVGEWDVPPEQNLYPVRSTIGNSLMGFRAVGDGTASPTTLRVNGTVTYQWTSNDTQIHKLSLIFNSYASTANIQTEWYVPGYEATTLPVGIGEDLAYSIIYAAGDSPPVPPYNRE